VGVAGTFGVGNVVGVGSESKVKPNTQVLFLSESGSWTNTVVVPSSNVYEISRDLSIERATLLPEVAFAWAVLDQGGPLKQGAVVVRSNTGTSVFNAAVDFICQQRGVAVISAKESDLSDRTFLQSLEAKGGAQIIISGQTGHGLRSVNRAIRNGGCLVTWNGPIESISQPGVDVAVAKAIFNDHSVKGFDFASLAYNNRDAAARAISAAADVLSDPSFTHAQVAVFAEDGAIDALQSLGEGKSARIDIH
jgi:NADPH:quinone reductase-like Zn-dependent oxidoreductase